MVGARRPGDYHFYHHLCIKTGTFARYIRLGITMFCKQDRIYLFDKGNNIVESLIV